MNRRSFITGILAMSVAPMFLPGGGRLWKATYDLKPNPIVFADFRCLLLSQLPFYDKAILTMYSECSPTFDA